MLGGTGGSLMVVSAAASLPENLPYAPVLLSLLIIGAGLTLVWLEIGRPWRFINAFFHPQTSWMTREAGVAILLFALAIAGLGLHQPILIAFAALAGLAFLYCQAMMLRAAKGIPAWRVAAIVPVIMSTGLSEGTALLVLIQSITTTEASWLIYLLPALAVVRMLAWQNYIIELTATRAPRATLSVLRGINWNIWIVGGALPVALVLSALAFPDVRSILYSIAALLVLLIGWHMKFTLVTRAAHVQGFALPVP